MKKRSSFMAPVDGAVVLDQSKSDAIDPRDSAVKTYTSLLNQGMTAKKLDEDTENASPYPAVVPGSRAKAWPQQGVAMPLPPPDPEIIIGSVRKRRVAVLAFGLLILFAVPFLGGVLLDSKPLG